MRRRQIISQYLILGAWCLATFSDALSPVNLAHAQVAGAIGSVNQDATGAPPGRPPKQLAMGASVAQNERIQTKASGTAQIIFNDRSTLNIGRNSSVVIDKFVYDPGGGNQILTLAKGAARFVGGQISHSSQTTVNTPAASIGVRGGNVSLVEQGDGSILVMVHNGSALITNDLGSQTVRAGYQLLVQPGVLMSAPAMIDGAQLRAVTQRMASQNRQTGGARKPPSKEDLEKGGIGEIRSTAKTPSFDLPAAGDEIARAKALTKNQTPILPIPPEQPRNCYPYTC